MQHVLRRMSAMTLTENTQQEAVSRLSRWLKHKGKICFAFGVLCLVSGVILLLVMFLSFNSCTNCDSAKTDQRYAEQPYGPVAIVLILIGLIVTLHQSAVCKSSSSPPEVVVSEIPAGDLEKTPAPLLPYNHIPHYQPYVEASSIELPDYFTTGQNSNHIQIEATSRDLPDYHTAVQNSSQTSNGELPEYFGSVQNIDDDLSSLNVGLWTDDAPRTPPPCYAQALEMESWAATTIYLAYPIDDNQRSQTQSISYRY